MVNLSLLKKEMKEDLNTISSWKDLFELLIKFGGFIFYITIGWVANLCYKVMRKQRISIAQVFASMGIALFVGFISAMVCIKHNKEMAPYVVPVCTYVSDKIVLGLANINWKDIIQNIVKNFTGGGGK